MSNPNIHASAVIEAGAQIGAGTRIRPFVHVSAGARIGAGCVIQQNVSVTDGVTLEDDVMIGPTAVFANVHNPRAHVPPRDAPPPTRVKRGATIGANATILCGVTIGEYAFVGAGAVVRHDVAAHAVVVGVPAGWIGWMCACGERLPHADGTGRMTCGRCGDAYRTRDGGVVKDGG
jgi:UDP-2-acetamido-3-amino-2,3-dideoxy-glucuronate N-acetyltransferase